MIMRDIEVEKVVLNVGCGVKLSPDIAKTVLERLSGRKAVIIRSRKRSTFNIPKNKPIGCKVTIRKGKDEFLGRLLEAKEKRLLQSSFDTQGNFAFGIKEYIDVPGMEYDPKIGIIGMDVCITLQRKGYSIKRKMISRKVGKAHLITKKDAIDFMKSRFSINVEE
jgi:large subunit ribosomal protein L5